MSLFVSLLSPELALRPSAANSVNSFAFKRFKTLFTLRPVKISRNSSGINCLRTLCRKYGEGVPPSVQFFSPLDSRHSTLATRLPAVAGHCPFLFNHLPPLSQRNRPVAFCFQQLTASFIKNRCFRTTGTSLFAGRVEQLHLCSDPIFDRGTFRRADVRTLRRRWFVPEPGEA